MKTSPRLFLARKGRLRMMRARFGCERIIGIAGRDGLSRATRWERLVAASLAAGAPRRATGRFFAYVSGWGGERRQASSGAWLDASLALFRVVEVFISGHGRRPIACRFRRCPPRPCASTRQRGDGFMCVRVDKRCVSVLSPTSHSAGRPCCSGAPAGKRHVALCDPDVRSSLLKRRAVQKTRPHQNVDRATSNFERLCALITANLCISGPKKVLVLA